MLEEYGVRYVVIGGFAAQMHGVLIPRTRDVDAVPALTSSNLERLSEALRKMNARLRVAGHGAKGIPIPLDRRMLEKVSMMNFVTDHGPFDITFQPSGTEGYEDLLQGSVVIRVGFVDGCLLLSRT